LGEFQIASNPEGNPRFPSGFDIPYSKFKSPDKKLLNFNDERDGEAILSTVSAPKGDFVG
jgi:hypothetical protein